MELEFIHNNICPEIYLLIDCIYGSVGKYLHMLLNEGCFMINSRIEGRTLTGHAWRLKYQYYQEQYQDVG